MESSAAEKTEPGLLESAPQMAWVQSHLLPEAPSTLSPKSFLRALQKALPCLSAQSPLSSLGFLVDSHVRIQARGPQRLPENRCAFLTSILLRKRAEWPGGGTFL
ncbi:TPA: hypothetical protein BOS_23466 [Bos taurus]|nr:TPA: hypothetical protein BOS_23466 [Bos taurus]